MHRGKIRRHLPTGDLSQRVQPTPLRFFCAGTVDGPSLCTYLLRRTGPGEFIWADTMGDRITVMRSRDVYKWDKLAEIPLEADGDAKPKGSDLSLLKRDDGSYEILANVSYWGPEGDSTRPAAVRNLRFLSAGGRNWRRDKQIGVARGGEQFHQGNIEAVHVNGRTVMGDFKQGPPALLANARFYREAADGGWEFTPPTQDIGSKYMTMTYSNRWGYILAWKFTPGGTLALEHLGPFVKIGHGLGGFEFEPVEVSQELLPRE